MHHSIIVIAVLLLTLTIENITMRSVWSLMIHWISVNLNCEEKKWSVMCKSFLGKVSFFLFSRCFISCKQIVHKTKFRHFLSISMRTKNSHTLATMLYYTCQLSCVHMSHNLPSWYGEMHTCFIIYTIYAIYTCYAIYTYFTEEHVQCPLLPIPSYWVRPLRDWSAFNTRQRCV